jgi:hypothetical protein
MPPRYVQEGRAVQQSDSPSLPASHEEGRVSWRVADWGSGQGGRDTCSTLLVVELATLGHRPSSSMGLLAVRSGRSGQGRQGRPVGEARHTGHSRGRGVCRIALTWLATLGCALQVAVGATTVLLEDPIFETSCRAEKSFKFWLVRATSDVLASPTIEWSHLHGRGCLRRLEMRRHKADTRAPSC